MNLDITERLDGVREVTGRAAVAGLAVGQRLAAAGAGASERARERGTSLPAHLRRLDAKRTANTALWGFQAGSKVPGGPYSTALGTGLGAAYGAYRSASEYPETSGAVESNPETAPATGSGRPRVSPERASAMALGSYDWYKRGRDRWGLKGGLAGATFGLARGFYDDPANEN